MLASETIVIYRVSVMVEATTDILNNNKTAVMKINIQHSPYPRELTRAGFRIKDNIKVVMYDC